MEKKYGIAIGAGILALACGIIALSKLDDIDKAERELKKAVKKVKRKSQKLATKVADKTEDVVDEAAEFIRNFED